MIPIARHTDSFEYLIYVFILLSIGLVFQRFFYPKRFSEYAKLGYNTKYILIYRKKEKIIHPFTLVSILSQALVIALYLFLWEQHFSLHLWELTGYHLLDFFIWVLLFFVIKWLFQLFIIYVFDILKIGYDYMFDRISYNNYAGILAGIIGFIVIYTFRNNFWSLLLASLLYLIIYLAGLLRITKSLQKIIIPYLFYFILYLCTLEIIPCIIIYYWIRQA